MKVADTEPKDASKAADSNAANTRLYGSWLIIARVVWLALVIPTLGLFLVSLPVYYQQLQKVCINNTICSSLPGVLTPKGLEALVSTGVTSSEYAILFMIYTVLITELAPIWWRKETWAIL